MKWNNIIATFCRIMGITLVLLAFNSCSLNGKTEMLVNSPEQVVGVFEPTAVFCNMVIVAKSGHTRIWMDTNTGVLYYRYVAGYNGAITPIMKPDGTCLTIDEWKAKVNYKEH